MFSRKAVYLYASVLMSVLLAAACVPSGGKGGAPIEPQAKASISDFLTDENLKIFINNAPELGRWYSEVSSKDTDSKIAKEMRKKTGWSDEYMMRASLAVNVSLDSIMDPVLAAASGLRPEAMTRVNLRRAELLVAQNQFMEAASKRIVERREAGLPIPPPPPTPASVQPAAAPASIQAPSSSSAPPPVPGAAPARSGGGGI